MVKREARPSPRGRKREPPKAPPSARTYAEEFYYRKQMTNRTPMVIRMSDGQELRGRIEWYDHDCLKLSCDEGPDVLVMKVNVRYMHKQREDDDG